MGGSAFYIVKLSKQVSALQQQIKDLEKETSPFAKIPEDPYYDVKENQKGPITTIAFAKKEFDFGTVKENVLSNTSFTFTNTGTADLLVSNAIGSCGCTVPEWPEKPIENEVYTATEDSTKPKYYVLDMFPYPSGAGCT